MFILTNYLTNSSNSELGYLQSNATATGNAPANATYTALGQSVGRLTQALFGFKVPAYKVNFYGKSTGSWKKRLLLFIN